MSKSNFNPLTDSKHDPRNDLPNEKTLLDKNHWEVVADLHFKSAQRGDRAAVAELIKIANKDSHEECSQCGKRHLINWGPYNAKVNLAQIYAFGYTQQNSMAKASYWYLKAFEEAPSSMHLATNIEFLAQQDRINNPNPNPLIEQDLQKCYDICCKRPNAPYKSEKKMS